MEQMLQKVAALLAKAEATDHPEEAEAFIAGAQRLASTHSIDLAMARQAHQRKNRRERPEQRRMTIGQPRAKSNKRLVQLFLAIAHPNDLKVDITHDNTAVITFGFPSDLNVVEAMYASLATQMLTAANSAIAAGEHLNSDARYWSETTQTWRNDARVFKSSFYTGFTWRIHERLEAARQEVVAERSGRDNYDPDSGTSVALVLATKRDEVNAFHKETSQARGSWARPKSTANVAGGTSAGRRAGDRASLSETKPLTGRESLPEAR